MRINAKRAVVASLLSGGVAAIAFGGSAVSTAWSDSSSGHIKAGAATVSNAITTGDFSLSNALPGDKSDPVTVSYANNGSTAEAVTFTLNPSGTGLGDLAKHVTLVLPGVGSVHVGDLPASYNLATVQPGGHYSLSNAYIQLDSDAPQGDSGASFDATYTVTATATH